MKVIRAKDHPLFSEDNEHWVVVGDDDSYLMYVSDVIYPTKESAQEFIDACVALAKAAEYRE